MHGVIVQGFLIKRGKQVQKFWKYDGYGISEQDLNKLDQGVILYTQYDGVLYAYKDTIRDKGIIHDFDGEKQYILPVKDWSVK